MKNSKEKALELVDKFHQFAVYDTKRAKQCALIAVDELINSHFKLTTTHEKEPSIRCKSYWQQVKTEINNL
jgi:hypothetical protein